MRLFLAKPRGFCAGVVRAIQTVERALDIWGPPIYVRHPIVHNRHVVKNLEKKGAVFVEEFSGLPKGARVIYSAHGVSPSVREEAKRRAFIEIDASCGLVTRVHSAVKRYAKKGYQILLIGHKTHVEVIGTAGEAPERTTIIESVEEVERLPFSQTSPLFYATQTTLSLGDVKEIVDALKKKYPLIETLPTSSICYATTNRQVAVQEISHFVDLILVVGDPESSNSNRLCEVVQKRGIPSYLINCPDEIQPAWFDGVETLGLTAGASTPEPIVQQCLECLYRLGVTETKEVESIQENVFFELPKEILEASSSWASIGDVSVSSNPMI